MNEQLVTEKCKEFVLQKLKSPASAKFDNIEIIEQDYQGRVLLDVTVDSQNSFGAMVRTDLWVVLHPYNQTYKVTPKSICQKSFINTKNVAKRVNNWDCPIC